MNFIKDEEQEDFFRSKFPNLQRSKWNTARILISRRFSDSGPWVRSDVSLTYSELVKWLNEIDLDSRVKDHQIRYELE